MNQNPLKSGVLTHGSLGLGTVNRGMVRERAVELARIGGRSAHETSKADWDEAMVQLTGVAGREPEGAALELMADSGGWGAVASSTGERVPSASGEDEDEEGRSDQQLLVEEGLVGAELDHRLQAAGPPADGALAEHVRGSDTSAATGRV